MKKKGKKKKNMGREYVSTRRAWDTLAKDVAEINKVPWIDPAETCLVDFFIYILRTKKAQRSHYTSQPYASPSVK